MRIRKHGNQGNILEFFRTNLEGIGDYMSIPSIPRIHKKLIQENNSFIETLTLILFIGHGQSVHGQSEDAVYF